MANRLSAKTKVCYAYHINEFLAFYKITDSIEPLKEYSPKLIKQMVKDYVLYLRDVRKLSRTLDVIYPLHLGRLKLRFSLLSVSK